MGWRIEFDPRVEKHLRRIGQDSARRILSYMHDRVARLETPRMLGKPLKGERLELWRYRVGQYRILCMIEDEHHVVIVLRIGHRRNISR